MSRITSRDAFTYDVYQGKLQAYEDLEEDGYIIRLPIRVGDCFYWINTFEHEIEAKVCTEITINNDGKLFISSSDNQLYDPDSKLVCMNFEEVNEMLEELGGL